MDIRRENLSKVKLTYVKKIAPETQLFAVRATLPFQGFFPCYSHAIFVLFCLPALPCYGSYPVASYYHVYYVYFVYRVVIDITNNA